MKVYLVVGGWDYEGEHAESLVLFMNKVDADNYAKDLEDGKNNSGRNEDLNKYDYVVNRQEEVVP